MKLGKVTVNDPQERLALGLRKSVVDNLKSYQAFYQNTTGEGIAMNLLVEAMVKAFMKDDRDFQRFRAASATPTPAVTRGRPKERT